VDPNVKGTIAIAMHPNNDTRLVAWVLRFLQAMVARAIPKGQFKESPIPLMNKPKDIVMTWGWIQATPKPISATRIPRRSRLSMA